MAARRTFLEKKRRIGAAALAGLLAWQGVVAVRGIVDSVRADEHSWRFRLTASLDERIHDALGPDYAAYRAVVDHVPKGAWLVLNGASDEPTLLLITRLIALLYPRQVVPRDEALRLAEAGTLRPTDRCFVLDLLRAVPPYPEHMVREVARGERFVLLEQRSGG